jgi:hypothetical protein
VTPQEATNYLKECYSEINDVAHELASVNLVVDDADEEDANPDTDTAANEPQRENPTDAFDD